jgi:transposase
MVRIARSHTHERDSQRVGQAHDGRSAADMFGTVEAGHILLADRAYDGDALRATITEWGTWANICAMPNRIETFPFSTWVLPPAQRG